MSFLLKKYLRLINSIEAQGLGIMYGIFFPNLETTLVVDFLLLFSIN